MIGGFETSGLTEWPLSVKQYATPLVGSQQNGLSPASLIVYSNYLC